MLERNISEAEVTEVLQNYEVDVYLLYAQRSCAYRGA